MLGVYHEQKRQRFLTHGDCILLAINNKLYSIFEDETDMAKKREQGKGM